MNDTLVQNMDLLDEQAMYVHSEYMQYKAESIARQYAQKGSAFANMLKKGSAYNPYLIVT